MIILSDDENVKVHFTYKADIDSSSLCQGDLLEITDEIREVLKEIHPYFLNAQYKYFMVLTQSCDLVRRGSSKCKTPYITLAAVKNFDSVFEYLLIKNKFAEKVNDFLLMDEKHWNKAYQLLERIYNNTESDYFFLYKEGNKLPDSMIVSLKVSIALKSDLHYQKCLDAKVLELSDEFKAKLGWLVGNIYSRVGTTDWESILSYEERKDMLKNELNSHCVVAEKPQISALKKELKDSSDLITTSEEAAAFISKCNIESTYDQVIAVLADIINSSSKKIPESEKERLLKTIKSRTKLKTLLSN